MAEEVLTSALYRHAPLLHMNIYTYIHIHIEFPGFGREPIRAHRASRSQAFWPPRAGVPQPGGWAGVLCRKEDLKHQGMNPKPGPAFFSFFFQFSPLEEGSEAKVLRTELARLRVLPGR